LQQTVYDAGSRKYSFTQLDEISGNGSFSALPVSVEDRNGNLLNFSWSFGSASFSMTDTLGRTLSASNFGTSGGTVTVPGLPAYTLQWTTVSPSYSVYPHAISGNGSCGPVLTAGGTLSVISSITLPNSEGSYTFQYDPTYGRVSQITYPTGAWIKYTWGLTDTLSEAVAYANTTGFDQACQYQMYAPVVRSRQVSYDGQHVALTQTFTYSTTWDAQTPLFWDSKTTIVTTTDNLRNLTATTTYTYIPIFSPVPPNETSKLTEQLPLENTITYKDWDGSVKRTVTKGFTGYWGDLLSMERVALDGGQTSETDYSYAGLGWLKEKDEYDYGSSPHGALLRKTVTNYAVFSLPIYGRPSSVIVDDGSGTRIEETDYTYDASGLTASGVGVGHDSSYSTSQTVRGNATSMQKWVNTGGSWLTWNYTYDDTGQ